MSASMLRFVRLVIGSVALAAVVVPLLPLSAAATSGCAMCSRNCCCNPSGGREACRLSRPCGDPAGENATWAGPGAARTAVLDAVAPEAVPPEAASAAPSPVPGHPDATSDPPPVPPPRSSAAG